MKLLPIKRILLKISGEALLGDQSYGVDPKACIIFAKQVKRICEQGVSVGIVTGAGNICRGETLLSRGVAKAPADHVGMLATLMNGIVLRESFLSEGYPVRLFSALAQPSIAETFNWLDVNQALENKEAVIFAGGTGNPYFTTDTAAALRACEIKADLLLKATKVEGVYDKDPKKYDDAIFYKNLTYKQALADDLKVMDAAAIALCRDNRVPITVFNMCHLQELDFIKLISTQQIGTLVQGE